MIRFVCAILVASWAIGPAARAQGSNFVEWLDAFKREAASRGVAAPMLESAFADVAPIPRVIELDRRQPESAMRFATYRKAVVSPKRVADGKAKLSENRSLLDVVGARFSVQPRFIVALWGIETSYGRATGDYPVIASLATLAWDGRRSAFFRNELFDALVILEQGHVPISRMRGSWAGAMGQSQFMPSSFLKYAVDFDGDGKRDIWSTRADVFASAANYLAQNGWKGDQTWGRAIRIPADFAGANLGLDVSKPLEEWRSLGIKRTDGGALPLRGDVLASVVRPDGPNTQAFLVYENFRTLLRWNRSTFFALSVGELADKLGDG